MAEETTRDFEPIPRNSGLGLLEAITSDAVDPDYQRVATQKGIGATAHARTRVGAGLVVILLGLLVATAAVQRQENAETISQSRTLLISRITEQRDDLETRQEYLSRLQAETSEVSEESIELGQRVETQANRVRALGEETGFAPVSEPGVRITVDNAPDADEREFVLDADLALLVNGLWSVGAEAISINGQRLTSLTAIRESGGVIEINQTGIAAPYTVRVIGDRLSLEADFYDTTSGLGFAELVRRYGFVVEFTTVDELSLPAGPARLLTLRTVEAQPPPTTPEEPAP